MRLNLGRLGLVLVTVIGLLGLYKHVVSAADKIKADELVAKYLDALGPADARAAVKSMSVDGNAVGRFVMGGAGQSGGPFTIYSAGHKVTTEMKFETPDYPGEQYAFDGDKRTIGYLTPGQRSWIEDFLNNSGEPVSEGLLDGELSTAWPLYDWQERKARLDSDGLKKVDGKEYYRLTYHAKKGGGDLKIYIFFDPQTFRHMKTIYNLQGQAQMGTSPSQSSAGSGVNVTLEENFGGFTNVNGLMLPTQWMLKFTQEGSGNGNSIIQYDMTVGKIVPNADVSAKTFRVAQSTTARK
ncbi:MAG TPA: hypothetical protein VGI16_02295 [Candidatus Acidoferrum sp.]